MVLVAVIVEYKISGLIYADVQRVTQLNKYSPPQADEVSRRFGKSCANH